MESEDVNPSQSLSKQESPVKDAVRSLEAQLASEVSINPTTTTEEEVLPQEQIGIPLEEVVINTQATQESSEIGIEQQEVVESVSLLNQNEQVQEHVIPVQVHVVQEQQVQHQSLQEQQLQQHQQQLQQLPEQHQQQLQQIPEQHQQQLQQIPEQHQQQLQQIPEQHQQQLQQLPEQHQQQLQQIPEHHQQQLQQIQQHIEQHTAQEQQLEQQHVVHQQILEKALLAQQQLPEQLHVQLVEEQPMETEQQDHDGSAVVSIGADHGAMQIEANGDASQSETAGSDEVAAQPFFKCVAVTSDGSPDWSKVMNLNRDILKEVLEKHGISMDTSDWPAQTEEDSASRKRKKKAKKAKKKKMKERSKGHKAGDSSWCSRCCRQFENQGSLKIHMRMHDEEINEGPRKCSICSLVFQRKIGLRAHMRKSHPDEYSKDEDIKDDGDFLCEETGCDRTFTTKMGLSQHINQHHKGLGKKKSYIKREPGELKCTECDKTFTMPHKLTQHMSTHSDARPYSCTQCDGTFKHHSSLRTHELIHSNKDACSCPVCGTMFKRAQYVRRHMIRVHDLLGVNYIPPAPVKRYPCEMCHRAYERRSELSDHMNSHTGAKPHLCEICAKGFAHKRALDVHRKTHTGKGAFHCDVCGKVFGSKSRMREHRVIHTGEKPFICQQCGSRFAHRANLREHLKSVHKTGVEPLPRGRRKGQRKDMTVQMMESIKEPEQQQGQQTLQYEVLTTRPHPQIDQAGQQQVQATQIVPIGIQHHQQQPQQVVQGQQDTQPQQIMYQEIQLQPVVVQGNSNMRTMQVQQVGQGGQIETRHDDLASVAQIVLQLHTEGTYTVQ